MKRYRFFDGLGLGLAVVALVLLAIRPTTAQCDNPPNGESCLCSTAPLLCTPDELNGFQFSMSDEQNDGDLPTGGFFGGADLCPGIDDQDGFPNNVNFFAFIAWCENLTIDVLVTNCLDNPDDNMDSYGIQMALFGGCGSQYNNWEPVACLTDGGDYCFDDAADVPPVQTFVTTGLTVGNTYYFMLDGCARSTCDIELDVIGTCGTGEIDDWTTGITGPETVCAGATYTYTAEDVDGAVEFYYYVDGVLITSGTEQTTFDHSFATAGTYEICVDVSNLPCILETDSPDQSCMTVTVVAPDPGTITASPQPACPGSDIDITVTDYADDPGTGLVLYIVDENNTVVQVIMGDNTTATYDECETWTAYAISYITAFTPSFYSVGDNYGNTNCEVGCCEAIDEPFGWDDTEPPTLDNMPSDATVDCEDDIPVLEVVNYTDNCLGSGTVTAVEDADYTLCDGGTLTRTWTVADSCNNPAMHTQTVTIDPVPMATFTDPPASATVTCDQATLVFPDLTLTNSSTGACLILETISPNVDDQRGPCGGDIIATWMYTDLCNRPYEVMQTLTVEPPAPPTPDMTPSDITLACGEPVPDPAVITISNGLTGDCELTEIITAAVQDNTVGCDGSITYTWTYTDNCNNDITLTQVITITPPAPPVFTSLPPSITITCAEIPTTTEDLTVDNGQTGACQILDTVSPTTDDQSSECGGTITYQWEYTDICDRTITHSQVLTVEPAPEGAFVNVPEDVTADCGDMSTQPADLTLTNMAAGTCLIEATVSPAASAPPGICGGDITYTWTYTDDCDRTTTETQTVTINPAPEATWDMMPPTLTVACSDFDPVPAPLSYSNGLTGDCAIAGTVAGALQGTPGPCGEDVNYLWEYTDDCNRTISITQAVDIEEADLPVFENMPIDVTISCNEVDPTPPTITYSNGGSGDCDRSGSVQAIQSGSFDACGGLLTYTWTATDQCSYTITYSQNVTVTPGPSPAFIDPPDDIVLGCGELVPDPILLAYDNGEIGDCNISGTVPATVFQDGLTTTYTWTYTTTCTPPETITYMQTIQESSEPDIDINPVTATICEGDVYDLSDITVTDLNGGAIVIEYLDQDGNLLPSSIVSPLSTTAYVIRILNQFSCEDDAEFILVVDSPPSAGTGIVQTACVGTETFNLFDLLVGPYGNDGTWFDTDFTALNLNDPTNVNISSLLTGTYQFDYEVPSGNTCPAATSTGFLEIVEAPTLTIIDEECNDNSTAYIVTVIVVDGQLDSDVGSITVFGDGSATISDIPLTDAVTITVTDAATGCSDEVTIGPIVCDCPDVPEPEPGPNVTICEGETVPELTVTVASGISANWYEANTGGTAIATAVTSYIPAVMNPGVYTYYVQGVDAQGCTSTLRVPVTFEIVALPTVAAVVYQECPASDGILTVDLSATISPLVNTNISYQYQYYSSEADAMSGSDEILPATISTSTTSSLYVVVTNPQGCAATEEIIVQPYALPSFTITPVAESCEGATDGSITIADIQPMGSLFDLGDTDYNDTTLYENLAPATYTVQAISPDGCASEEQTTIPEGVLLQLADISVLCDFNDTELDPNDDTYTISFTTNADDGNITVTDPSGMEVALTGTNPVTWTIPADENITNIDYLVTDTESGCTTSIATGPLTPCSTDCSFDLSPLEPECNGGGTPTDPTDDFYTIEISATAINGNAASFIISVNNVLTAVSNYGTTQTLTLPANDSTATITITDSEDSQCFVSTVVGPLTPCSNDCLLDFDSYTAPCNFNGTAGIQEDDFYDITFGFDSTNPPSDSAIVLVDGTPIGIFGYSQQVSITLPAGDTDQSITIVDQIDGTCSASIIQELTPCSGNCSLVAIATTAVCDINGTADIIEDDTYTAEITVTIDDGASQWIIPSEGVTGMIGLPTVVGPYMIASGDTTLIITDSENPACSDTITLVAPPPCSVCEGEVEAGNGGELTCDISSITLIGSSTPVGILAYWTSPTGQQTTGNQVSATSIGTYTYSVDYGDGCIISDSTQVTNDDSIPIAITSDDQVYDCNTDSLLLTGSVMGGTGPYEYSWTDASGTVISTAQTAIAYAPGIYNLAVTDLSTGCISPIEGLAVIDATAGPTAQIYPDPDNVLDCVIEVIFLTSDNEENTVYQWSVNGQPVAAEGLSITQAADVALIAIDTTTGCQNTDSLQIVSLEEYPIINLAPVANLDCDVEEVTIDATGSQSGSNITYTWYNEENDIIAVGATTITVTEAGSYVVLLTDVNNNCENSDTVIVENTGDFPTISLPLTQTITCDATSASVIVTVDPAVSNESISWQAVGGSIVAGDGTTEVTVDGPGTYTVLVTNLDNGCTSDATIEVNYPDLISDVAITVEDESCTDNSDGTITIDITTGGTPPYLFVLDGDTINNTAVVGLVAGSYLLQVVDENNCTFDTLITVDVLPAFEVSLPGQVTVQQGVGQSLTVVTEIPIDEIAAVQWTPADQLDCDTCLTVTYEARSSQAYSVVVTDIYGCTASTEVEFLVTEAVDVYVPNVFNPAGDSPANRFFYPITTEAATVLVFSVYDRWGNLVYTNENFPANAPAEGWDGLFGNQAPVPGVYVYYMEVAFEGRPVEKIAGDITLIRQ